MHHQIILPQVGFVRLPTILQLIPVSKSTWWAKVKKGAYPKPVKLGGNITAWRAEDIHQLIKTINEYSTGSVGGGEQCQLMK